MKPCEFRAPLPSNARQRAATGVGHNPLAWLSSLREDPSWPLQGPVTLLIACHVRGALLLYRGRRVRHWLGTVLCPFSRHEVGSQAAHGAGLRADPDFAWEPRDPA